MCVVGSGQCQSDQNVHSIASYSSRTSLRFIKSKVFAQIFRTFLQLRGQRLPTCKAILQLLLAFIGLPLLCFQRLCIDILSAFTCLPPNLHESQDVL